MTYGEIWSCVMKNKKFLLNKPIELLLVLSILVSGVISMYGFCFESIYRSISMGGYFSNVWIINSPNNEKRNPNDLKDEQSGAIGGVNSSCTGVPCTFSQLIDNEKILTLDVGYLHNFSVTEYLNYLMLNVIKENTFGRYYIDTKVVLLC